MSPPMDMGFDDSTAAGHAAAPGLRPLGWAELCARLSAAQDLRRATSAPLHAHTAQDADGWAGSFHPLAALWLAQDEPSRNRYPETAINPMPSANGKDAGDTSGASRSDVALPIRAERSRRELP